MGADPEDGGPLAAPRVVRRGLAPLGRIGGILSIDHESRYAVALSHPVRAAVGGSIARERVDGASIVDRDDEREVVLRGRVEKLRRAPVPGAARRRTRWTFRRRPPEGRVPLLTAPAACGSRSATSAQPALGAPTAPSSPRSRPGPHQAPVRPATAPRLVGLRARRRPHLVPISTGPELSPDDCTPDPVGFRPVDDCASGPELARCRASDLVVPSILPRDCTSYRVGPPISPTTATVPDFLTKVEGCRPWWGREEQGQRGPAPALGRRRGCTPARADSSSLSLALTLSRG